MTVRELFAYVGFKKIWSYLSRECLWISDERDNPEKHEMQQQNYKSAYSEILEIKALEPWDPGLLILINGVTASESKIMPSTIVWCPHKELGMFESVETLQWGRIAECAVFQKSLDEYSYVFVAGELLVLMTEDGFSDKCSSRLKSCLPYWKSEYLPIGYLNTRSSQTKCHSSNCDEWGAHFEERLPGAIYDERWHRVWDSDDLKAEDYLKIMHREPEKYIAKNRLFEKWPPFEAPDNRVQHPHKSEKTAGTSDNHEDRLTQRCDLINSLETLWIIGKTEWYSFLQEKGIWRRG